MFRPSAIVGDIAPSDNVTKEVKNQLETEAMCKIRDMLGHNTAAGELHENAPMLWCQEFCTLVSNRAHSVEASDATAGVCTFSRLWTSKTYLERQLS